jgi:hypothetical protein
LTATAARPRATRALAAPPQPDGTCQQVTDACADEAMATFDRPDELLGEAA